MNFENFCQGVRAGHGVLQGREGQNRHGSLVRLRCAHAQCVCAYALILRVCVLKFVCLPISFVCVPIMCVRVFVCGSTWVCVCQSGCVYEVCCARGRAAASPHAPDVFCKLCLFSKKKKLNNDNKMQV